MANKSLIIGIIVAVGFVISNVFSYLLGVGQGTTGVGGFVGISVTDYAIAAVAIYGAVLSSYGVFQDWDSKKYKIVAHLGLGITVQGPVKYKAYSISAKNVGERPVNMSSVAFNLPNKKILHIMDPLREGKLPHKLEPGEEFLIDYGMDKLRQTLSENGYGDLTEISVRFKDQLENEYHSNTLPVF